MSTHREHAQKLVIKISKTAPTLATDLERLAITEVCGVSLASTTAMVLKGIEQYTTVFSKTPLDSHLAVYDEFWQEHRSKLKGVCGMLPTLIKSGDTEMLELNQPMLLGIKLDDKWVDGMSIDLRWLLLAAIKVDIVEAGAQRKTLDLLHDIGRLVTSVLTERSTEHSAYISAKDFAISVQSIKISATSQPSGPAENMLGGLATLLQGYDNNPQLMSIMQSFSGMIPAMAKNMNPDITEEELAKLRSVDVTGAIKGVIGAISTGKMPTAELFEDITSKLKPVAGAAASSSTAIPAAPSVDTADSTVAIARHDESKSQ